MKLRYIWVTDDYWKLSSSIPDFIYTFVYRNVGDVHVLPFCDLTHLIISTSGRYENDRLP